MLVLVFGLLCYTETQQALCFVRLNFYINIYYLSSLVLCWTLHWAWPLHQAGLFQAGGVLETVGGPGLE